MSSLENQPGLHRTQEPWFGHGSVPYGYAQPPHLSAPSRREIAARSQVAFACFGLLVATLAACSKMGALRLADLAITLLVVGWTYVLALRDHRSLSVVVAGTWIFAPMVRRVVDWQLGGYTSLTALSLLPMLATMALAVPTLPRLNKLPFRVLQPIALVVVPIVAAAAVGFARYGPSAVPEAGGWILPILFVPYFATQPTTASEKLVALRQVILLSALSAAYAWYQYLVLPSWDRLWLVESGMTSSMGAPFPLQIRAWGTMNACGPAAAVWALAAVAAFSDRHWKSPLKSLAVVLIVSALLVTLVRIGWIMAFLGALVYAVQTGGRRAGNVVMGAALIALVLVAVPMLPGGERIEDRLDTLRDIKSDHSAQTRLSITESLLDEITENPFGVGLGYKTVGKLTGGSQKVGAVDNGVGDMFLSLSIPGGVIWAVGMFLILRELYLRTTAGDGPGRTTAMIALTLLCMCSTAMLAAFSFSGLVGMLNWFAVGIGINNRADAPPALGHFNWRSP